MFHYARVPQTSLDPGNVKTSGRALTSNPFPCGATRFGTGERARSLAVMTFWSLSLVPVPLSLRSLFSGDVSFTSSRPIRENIRRSRNGKESGWMEKRNLLFLDSLVRSSYARAVRVLPSCLERLSAKESGRSVSGPILGIVNQV